MKELGPASGTNSSRLISVHLVKRMIPVQTKPAEFQLRSLGNRDEAWVLALEFAETF